ncbi:anthranilate phosphoribosyltransferase [Teredinibacter turnerae T7901]|uniref:Anthranilate phosphoribosyltransferase n=1 Tax=Teredinibacter turnerae (strain ATCC 39867 / T7901) TaxID=377629 RepID=TRPD_TERTT|nr:anthranilate phosphoribosyltransferase [Teredinibacter turnerae]C5BPA3.1 RecName: Full=Anthranilate phosphoribosyltransferase [Teredinibacter turnerae T7901]ACR12252.1 anthranilate phosphoribosyltransferase [Teredinibacter turnerae T7901]
MNIQQALARVVAGNDLSQDEMVEVMTAVMSGQATPAQIGGFLVALRMKSESLDEITGAAMVMRELATKVEVSANNLVDTCGTGGDGANLFNVSTAAAFVVAAAGGHVAKHGNRSVSSSTGSADVLEAAGVNLSAAPDVVARAIENVGVGFMFAPAHHSAMKHAIGPRKELALRTIFNMLGPMTNPAGVKRQVIGVFTPALCRPMAEVLGRLGSEHVMIVCSDDGLDELSIAAPSHVAELKNGVVTEFKVDPADYGFGYSDLDGLSVTSAEESLGLIRGAFKGDTTELSQKAAAIIAINAGAAIYVAGLAGSMKDGVAMAEDALSSGLAAEKLKELIEFTNV